MTDKEPKTIGVVVPSDLLAEAMERAEAEDRPISNLMRVALRYYLRETTP